MTPKCPRRRDFNTACVVVTPISSKQRGGGVGSVEEQDNTLPTSGSATLQADRWKALLHTVVDETTVQTAFELLIASLSNVQIDYVTRFSSESNTEKMIQLKITAAMYCCSSVDKFGHVQC